MQVGIYEGTKHAFATDALRRGVQERHIQRFLGHSDVRSTHRYARLADEGLVTVLRAPTAPPMGFAGKDTQQKPARIQEVSKDGWRSGRDSNPRPPA